MAAEEEKFMEDTKDEEIYPKSGSEDKGNGIAKLREQLDSKEQENKNLQDKYVRLYAEFENFKKRASRDQEEYTKHANERLLKELLPVLDNLERAIYHAKEVQDSPKILAGLELVLKQFLEVMNKFGVSPFESYLKPFDPSKHQAIGQTDSDEHENGTVVEEVQRGYRFNDRILRPALVMVSKKSGM
jgi:molecular chaperone GrpE